MHRYHPFIALAFTAVVGITTCGAPASAYVSDKEKLNKAAAEIDAGNFKEGAVDFKRLADEGCPFAQCAMGIMYLNGKGVAKNVHTAIFYFTKSAKQGFPDAEEHLGEIYQFGEEGVKKDTKTAANWYRRASYHGNHKAQLALGKMFMNSHVTSEVDEAKVWLAKACQIPGAIADEAKQAFLSMPGMSDFIHAQDNFEFAMANVAAGGTLTRGPQAQSVPTQMTAPPDMPGALADDWDRFAGFEDSIARNVKSKL